MTNPYLRISGNEQLDWRAEALCAQTDPEMFFPGKGGDNRPAKRVCASCPVTAACLNWALRNGEDGIWGATSPRERDQLRKKLGIKPVTHWEHGDPGGAARHRREGTPPCQSCLRTENLQNYLRREDRTA